MLIIINHYQTTIVNHFHSTILSQILITIIINKPRNPNINHYNSPWHFTSGKESVITTSTVRLAPLAIHRTVHAQIAEAEHGGLTQAKLRGEGSNDGSDGCDGHGG